MKKIIYILFLLLITSAQAQNWFTIGGNNQKNGLSKMTGPSSANILWNVTSANSSLWGNSVFTYNDKFVTARVTFTPSYRAKVELRNLLTGAFIWEKQITDTSIMYAVGFTEDAVYATDYKTGKLYALNVSDGSVKWLVNSSMFPGNTGLCYACNGDPIEFGKRMDKNTGQIKWTNNYIIPVGPDGGYIVIGNTYYHWTGSIVTPKKLIAIDAETGVTKYTSADLPGDGDQENDLIAGPDGTIYITRDGGALYAFTDNGTTFVQKWSRTPGVLVKGFARDGIIYASNSSGNISGTNRLMRLNPTNGNLIDSCAFDFPASFYLPVTVGADSTVYVNTGETGNGRYFALSYDLQTVKWQINTPYNYYSGPNLSKDGILVTVGSGTNIIAYKTASTRKPVADFRASNTNIPLGQTTNFFDQSSYSPVSWQWEFQGGTPSSSTQQNPTNISYNTLGIYPIKLITTNSYGTDTLIRNCYINVYWYEGINNNNETVNDFMLYQNYPNPFNPKSKIKYQISKTQGTRDQKIRLEVFNSLGQEITTLVNQMQNTGTYEIEFDGTNYTSGVYFYQLIVGGNIVDTKKMLLIK